MRPYVLQPFRFFPYLGTKKLVWPKGIETLYYLSFEDALWDLLPRLGYKRNSVIFVPRFYCKDVAENMRNHGYTVVVYPQNDDYSYNVKEIMTLVEEYSPDVFVEFQIAGMRSTLLSEIERKLSLRTLIVSDRVHEFVYPHMDYFPHSDRHLIISSYRKVSAFNGSLAVFTRNYRKGSNKLPLAYTLHVLWLWSLFMIFTKASYLLSSIKLAKIADKTLAKHNDLIGDSLVSAPLPMFFAKIYSYFAIEKIFEVKMSQYRRYLDALSAEFEKYSWLDELSTIEEINYGRVRGFPIFIREGKVVDFLASAEKMGLLLFTQLDDLMDKGQKFRLVLLPLGPHLSDSALKNIIKRVKKALTLTNECGTITA